MMTSRKRNPSNHLATAYPCGKRLLKDDVNEAQSYALVTRDYKTATSLTEVLLVGSEKFTLIGNPLLSEETVRIMATVVEHSSAAKVIVFKKKRRKNYKRKRGHRQDVTVLRVNNIELANRSHSVL